MKKKIKRVILGTGKHWFYSSKELQFNEKGPYNLIGLEDDNGKLKALKATVESRKVKLVLEYEE